MECGSDGQMAGFPTILLTVLGFVLFVVAYTGDIHMADEAIGAMLTILGIIAAVYFWEMFF
jgi:hypothetical protein